MLKAIIFDFDGVIADTERARFNTLARMLEDYDLCITEDDFPLLVGRKTDVFLREKFPDMLEKTRNGIIEWRHNYFARHIVSVKLVPDVKELTTYLAERYKLAITTGSERDIVESILMNHSMTKLFEMIIAGGDYKISKADPGCYILTLESLGIKNSEAIIVEDSLPGIIAGHKAGCKVLGLKNDYNRGHLRDADMIFDNYSSMKKYFGSL